MHIVMPELTREKKKKRDKQGSVTHAVALDRKKLWGTVFSLLRFHTVRITHSLTYYSATTLTIVLYAHTSHTSHTLKVA